MVIAQDVRYYKPETVEEAIGLLGAESGSTILAGGTDLVAWMRDDVAHPEVLIDLKGVPGLDMIAWDGDALHLGALVTFSELLASKDIADNAPVFREMADLVASVGIRNRATVAGNICSAVPSCDAGPVLLAYDTNVRVVGPGGERVVPIDEWFVGPRRSALADGEIVVAMTVRPPRRHGAAFLKLARYEGEDLAQASLAVSISQAAEYRVAFGAVAPTPRRARRIEAMLQGKRLSDGLIAEAIAVVADEIAPISDIRAGKVYREHMCRVMLDRGLRAAAARLDGSGAPYPTRFI
jgi:carbon-monoxide dehydrogenase medium subunit